MCVHLYMYTHPHNTHTTQHTHTHANTHTLNSCTRIRARTLTTRSHTYTHNTHTHHTRVNWFSSELQSAFRESIGSVRDLGARIANHFVANHLIQMGTSERVSQIIFSNHLIQIWTSGARIAIIWFKQEEENQESSDDKETDVILWCSRHFTIHTFCLWPE